MKSCLASISSSRTSPSFWKTGAKSRAIILTHGHEDHIGALPFILPYLNVPVYGSSFTMGLVKNKLAQHGLLGESDLRTVKAKETDRTRSVSASSFFTSRTRSLTHSRLRSTRPLEPSSIPGDFKIDPTPIDGKTFDLHTLAAYGEQGVLALFSDSTNAERGGPYPFRTHGE